MKNNSNNQRILKNTIFLYIRMFILMFIGLYTSRIVLQKLGIEDFGIYNVVGGIVTMLAFISNTMSTATQRFLSFELGKSSKEINKIFSCSFYIYIIIGIIIIFFAETIGLWYVQNKLNVPPDRYIATQYVYQFSILAFLANIMRIPYNALIISHERMNFYAIISIIETLIKLLIVYILSIAIFDKLIFYSLLMFLAISITTLIYVVYCRLYFKESKLIIVYEKHIYKKMLGFAGWNLLGSISVVGMEQGLNLLLNIYFGPVINAARGIAYQVKAQVTSFVGNFQIASTPQIVKYYAEGEINKTLELVYWSSKFSYFLMLIIAVPVVTLIKPILNLWLDNVPKYTIEFVQLEILVLLCGCLSGTMVQAIQATGKIKKYQLNNSLSMLLVLPVAYFILQYHTPPYMVEISSIIFAAIIPLFVRIKYMNKLINMPIKYYLRSIVAKEIIVSLLSFLLAFKLKIIFGETWQGYCITAITSFLLTLSLIYYIGINKLERKKIHEIALYIIEKVRYN